MGWGEENGAVAVIGTAMARLSVADPPPAEDGGGGKGQREDKENDAGAIPVCRLGDQPWTCPSARCWGTGNKPGTKGAQEQGSA